MFSAGIATVSKEPDAGKALIKFLASPAAGRDRQERDGSDCDGGRIRNEWIARLPPVASRAR